LQAQQNFEESIVTIFKTDVDTKQLLQKFGINIFDDRIIDDTTLSASICKISSFASSAKFFTSIAIRYGA